ncbi:MAG: hypothetical protein Q7S05_00370 [bacterium]|nr:hypothetical protein [bacterium]
MSKNKTLIIASAVVVIIVIGLGVYMFLKANQSVPAAAPAGSVSYGTDNPLENKPDLNPADKTNPFKTLKTNPFD